MFSSEDLRSYFCLSRFILQVLRKSKTFSSNVKMTLVHPQKINSEEIYSKTACLFWNLVLLIKKKAHKTIFVKNVFSWSSILWCILKHSSYQNEKKILIKRTETRLVGGRMCTEWKNRSLRQIALWDLSRYVRNGNHQMISKYSISLSKNFFFTWEV